MATITSVGTGDWGTAGTWDAGVPADNDVVVIAAGHTVTFNVDQSGFANGIDGITITGTLKLTRTAGTYYLKVKAAKAIAGAGTFDCGASAGDAIPFAAKHTITGGTGWYINGTSGLIMTVFAAEPAIKTILLSGDEAAGQTILSVDTDVTGDIWADGDTIIIANINNAKNPESRVIAAGGIAAGAITVTAGLTATKLTGSLVHLATRNVRFIALGNMMRNFAANKLTIAGGEFTFTSGYATQDCFGINISGGIFHTGTYFVYNSTGINISGGIFTNGNFALGNGQGSTISGGTFSGLIYPVYGQYVNVTGGLFTGCKSGMFSMSGTIKNAIFRYNTYDIENSQVTCFNTLLGSPTEAIGYTNLSKEVYSESIDHDQTVGKFAAWTKGGVTASASTPVPTGYTTSYIITLADASNEGFWQKEVTVGAGASVNITMNLYKSGSMTYLPRCIIFNKAETDPFAGGAGIHTFTMTDSTTTWEAETYTYGNSTANDVTLVIRFQGKNASGTVATALLVEQINVDLTSALAKLTAIQAKTDNLPSDPADQSAVEAAITAAIPDVPTVTEIRQEMDSNSTQLAAILEDTGTTLDTLIKDVPTNSELAVALGTADDAVLSAIAALNNAPDVSADIGAIKTKTDNLPTDPADESLIEAAIAAIPAAPSTNDIMNTVVEGTYTVQDIFKIMAAVMAGKVSGGGTTDIKFRDLADALDRITATVDSNGNRTDVVLDLT